MNEELSRAKTHLTKAGGLFVVIVLVVLLAAWNTGTNLLYIIVAGLLSFLVLSWFLSRLSLRNVTVTRQAPDAIHRGQRCPITVRVENHKRLFGAVCLRFERVNAPGRDTAYVVKIPPRSTAEFRMAETFHKRGVHTLPDLRLLTAFPFGLMACSRLLRDRREIVVYPRLLSVRPTLLDQLAGPASVPKVRLGDGDEYSCLREYHPGDEPRRIAWRASARIGTLIVRDMEYNTSRYIIFFLDTRDAPHVPDFEDRFEEAIDTVASLAVTLLGRDYQVALATHAAYLPGGEGKGHVLKVLDMLARVTLDPGPAHDDWEHFAAVAETEHASFLCISPDPARWGHWTGVGRSRILDPRGLINA